MVVEGKSINVWGKGMYGESAPDSPKSCDLRPRVLKEFFAEFDIASVKQVVAGPTFSAVLSGAGTVFSFGAERWFNPSAKEDSGVELHFQKWDQISNVIMIDLGETFMVALTDSGDLYTWGTGQYGQLGLDSTMAASTPQLVKSLEGAVKQVACGYDNVAAVTKNGELYTWGRAQSGALGHGNEQDMKNPTLVKSLDGITVLQVKVGTSHMAALTDDGIYTWGNNFLGPLGRILGKGKDCDFVPRPIDLLQVGAQVTEENLKGADEINFVQLECLRFNTLALSDEGQVFSCGKGGIDGGGHGDSPHTLFCLVEAIKDVKVKSLSGCKANHVAALAENGDVWIWGNGDSGQLGLGEPQSQAYPKRLDALSGSKIIQISCGETHTIAISTVELDKDEIKRRRDEKLMSKKASSSNTPSPPAATAATAVTETPSPKPAAAPPIYPPESARQGDDSDSSGDSESDDDNDPHHTATSVAATTTETHPTTSASSSAAATTTRGATPETSNDDKPSQQPSQIQEPPKSDKPKSEEPQKTPKAEEPPTTHADAKPVSHSQEPTTAVTTPTAQASPAPTSSKADSDGAKVDHEAESDKEKPKGKSEPKHAEQPPPSKQDDKKKADSDDELVEEPLDPESKPAVQDKPDKSSPSPAPEKEDDEKKSGKGKKTATKAKDSDDEDSDDESGGKDAVGAADAASRGGHAGFLQKKGDKGLVKGWKKRFFVVDGEVIRYFANKGDKKEKGHIAVKDMVDLLEGSTKTGFNIVMRAKRVYELKAPTEEEMEKWISVLKELIKNQKKK